MIYAEGRDYEGMTLKEIAAEAGVSVSTVSRVINMKGPHVARPEIQNRIWEIVSRSGYTPNVHAVGLKRQSEPETESTRGGARLHCVPVCTYAPVDRRSVFLAACAEC